MHVRNLPLILGFILAGFASGAAMPAAGGETFPSPRWTIPRALPVDGIPEVPRSERIWLVSFVPLEPDAPALVRAVTPMDATAAGDQRPMAFEYSDGYNMRRKIHMAASWATVPLFVAQYFVGQDLYQGTGGETARSAHGALTASVAALFAVNTVTGVWNLWEGRKDPNGRTRRLVHGIVMLGVNAGFVAAGSMAPDDDEGGGGSDASAHRAVALTSMGVAVASYVYMFVTR